MNKATETGTVEPKDVYDFDFITGALGLARYHEGAFNPAQVIRIIQMRSGHCWIYLRDLAHDPIECTPEQMVEIEALIRKRQIQAKANQREMIKEQLLAQAQAMTELNAKPQPASGIPIIGRGGRH